MFSFKRKWSTLDSLIKLLIILLMMRCMALEAVHLENHNILLRTYFAGVSTPLAFAENL